MTSYSLWPALMIVSNSPVKAVCSLGRGAAAGRHRDPPASITPQPQPQLTLCWDTSKGSASVYTLIAGELDLHNVLIPNTHGYITRREGKASFLTPSALLQISMRRRSASVLMKGRCGGMQPGTVKENVYDPVLLHGSSPCIPRDTAKMHLIGTKC